MNEDNLGRLVEWLDVSSKLHVGRTVTGGMSEVVQNGQNLVVDTSLESYTLVWVPEGQLKEPVKR